MFQLLLLGAPLLMGAGLFGAASYTDGTLIAARSAAQLIGWLFVFSTLAALCVRASQRDAFKGLRHATFGEVTAAAVTFFSGVLMLYVSYFEWSEFPTAPVRYAMAETVPYKLIDGLPPVPTLVSTRTVTPLHTKHTAEIQHLVGPAKEVVAQVSLPRAKKDPCSAFAGVESLQCHRCIKESGLSLLMCHESARLEYCAERQGVEPSCPSAIPYSPPQ
jgi:hypothetical protein